VRDSKIDFDTVILLSSVFCGVVIVALVWLAIARPFFRSKVVSVLGGIAPISAIYLLASIDHLLNPPVGEEGLGMLMIAIATPWAYIVALIVGIGLAFTNRPRSMTARFFVSAFLAFVLFITITRLVI